MTLFKGREIVFKAFEIRIFLKLEQLEQSEKSEQSDQSYSDYKYTSLELDNDLNISGNSFSSGSDTLLFTPKK